MAGNISRAEAVTRIHRRWPEADEIRSEGVCKVCDHTSLYSFQLPGDGPWGKTDEICSRACVNCKWNNRGSRPSLDAETEGN